MVPFSSNLTVNSVTIDRASDRRRPIASLDDTWILLALMTRRTDNVTICVDEDRSLVKRASFEETINDTAMYRSIIASYNYGNIGSSGVNANCNARTLRIERLGFHSYCLAVRSIN